MTSLLATRPSPIAGQWHPADASQLAAAVDSYINAAQLPEIRSELLDLGEGLQRYAIFETKLRAGLNDVVVEVETSLDLESWTSPGGMEFLVQIDHGDGTIGKLVNDDEFLWGDVLLERTHCSA